MEIWCPVPALRKSYKKIIDHNLQPVFSNAGMHYLYQELVALQSLVSQGS